MKIYVNRNLFAIDGTKFKELGKDASKEDTGHERLGNILVEGLMRDLPGDESAGGGLKMRRWKLANKLHAEMKSEDPEHAVEMNGQDVEMIKQRLGRFLPTAILGPTYIAIDPSGEQDEPTLKAVD